MYLFQYQVNYFKNELPLEFLNYFEENLTFYGISFLGYYYIDDTIYNFLYKKKEYEKKNMKIKLN